MRLRQFLNVYKLYLTKPRWTYAHRKQVHKEYRIEKTMSDMLIMGISVPALWEIALPYRGTEYLDVSGKVWQSSEIGRLAAVKLLAETGQWNLELLAKFSETGYQSLMKEVDPLFAAVRKDWPYPSKGDYSIGRFWCVMMMDYESVIQYLRETPLNQLRRLRVEFWEKLLDRDQVQHHFHGHPRIEIRKFIYEEEDRFLKLMNQLPDFQKKILRTLLSEIKEEHASLAAAN